MTLGVHFNNASEDARGKKSRSHCMSKENSKPNSFPLRLPFSLRRQANDLAQRDGLSLNQFIGLAVAEKIARLEHVSWVERSAGLDRQSAIAFREMSGKN